MTLLELQTAVTEMASLPGVFINGTFLALAGNFAVIDDQLVATGVNGRTVRLAPAEVSTIHRASRDDCGEAGVALWGNLS